MVHLNWDIRSAGAGLTTDGDAMARLLSAFLHWSPIAPRSISQLVNSVAPLTRLLRVLGAVRLTKDRRLAAATGPRCRIETID